MSQPNPNQVPYDPRNPPVPPVGYNVQHHYPHAPNPYPGYPYPGYPYQHPPQGHPPQGYPPQAHPPSHFPPPYGYPYPGVPQMPPGSVPVAHYPPPQPTHQLNSLPQPVKSNFETWVPNEADSKQFDIWFSSLDTEFKGSIGGAQAVQFLKKSNLAKDTLREVWNVIDDKKTGQLDRLQFIAAVRMISILCNPSYAGSKPTVELYNNNIKKAIPIPSQLYQDDNKPIAIEIDMISKPMEQKAPVATTHTANLTPPVAPAAPAQVSGYPAHLSQQPSHHVPPMSGTVPHPAAAQFYPPHTYPAQYLAPPSHIVPVHTHAYPMPAGVPGHPQQQHTVSQSIVQDDVEFSDFSAATTPASTTVASSLPPGGTVNHFSSPSPSGNAVGKVLDPFDLITPSAGNTTLPAVNMEDEFDEMDHFQTATPAPAPVTASTPVINLISTAQPVPAKPSVVEAIPPALTKQDPFVEFHGKVSSHTTVSSNAFADEFEDDNDMGSFQSATQVQHHHQPTTNHVNPVLPSAVEDGMDDFGSFSGSVVTQPPLSATVPQSTMTTNKLSVFDEMVENDLQVMNEDWDDFAEATATTSHGKPVIAAPSIQKQQKTISNDDILSMNNPFEAMDHFSDSNNNPDMFTTSVAGTAATSTPFPSYSPAKVASKSAGVIVVEDVDSEDDDVEENVTFKDSVEVPDNVLFVEIDVPEEPKVTAPSLVFNDNLPPSTTVPVVHSKHEDDDFGDFETHTPHTPAASTSNHPVATSVPSHSNLLVDDNNDPFADIAIDVPVVPVAVLPTPDVASSFPTSNIINEEFEDDNFGAVEGPSTERSTEKVPTTTTPPVKEDIDPFADISVDLPAASSLPTLFDAQLDNTVVADEFGDAEDDFGDFEVHPTTNNAPALIDPFADISVETKNDVLSLHPVGSTKQESEDVFGDDNGDDDFGDFETHSPHPSVPQTTSKSSMILTQHPSTSTLDQDVNLLDDNLLDFAAVSSTNSMSLQPSGSSTSAVNLMDMDFLSMDYTPATLPTVTASVTTTSRTNLVASSFEHTADPFDSKTPAATIKVVEQSDPIDINDAFGGPNDDDDDDFFEADFQSASIAPPTVTAVDVVKDEPSKPTKIVSSTNQVSSATSLASTAPSATTILNKPTVIIPPPTTTSRSSFTNTSEVGAATTPSVKASNVPASAATPTAAGSSTSLASSASSFFAAAFGLGSPKPPSATTMSSSVINTPSKPQDSKTISLEVPTGTTTTPAGGTSLVTFKKTKNQAFSVQELEIMSEQLVHQYFYEYAYECLEQAHLVKQIQTLSEQKKNALEVDDLETAMKIKNDTIALQKQLYSVEDEYQWYVMSTTLPLPYHTSVEELYQTICSIDAKYGQLVEKEFMQSLPEWVPFETNSSTALSINLETVETYIRYKQSMTTILQLVTQYQSLPAAWLRYFQAVTPMITQCEGFLRQYVAQKHTIQLEIKNHYVLQHYVCNIIGVIESTMLICVSCLEGICHAEKAESLWIQCSSLLQVISKEWGLDSLFLNKSYDQFTLDAAILANMSLMTPELQITYCTFSLRPLFQYRKKASVQGKQSSVQAQEEPEIVKKCYTQYVSIDKQYYATPIVNIWKHDISKELPQTV